MNPALIENVRKAAPSRSQARVGERGVAVTVGWDIGLGWFRGMSVPLVARQLQGHAGRADWRGTSNPAPRAAGWVRMSEGAQRCPA
jgi:hypothetical protein